MRNIAALCADNGVSLSFCFLNEIGRASDLPESVERLESFAPIWYPPDSAIQNPLHYCDAIHFNADGAQAFSPFLVDRLKALYD